MNAPAREPASAARKTREASISPFWTKTPAGMRTTSLGKGMKEDSIVIKMKIPK